MVSEELVDEQKPNGVPRATLKELLAFTKPQRAALGVALALSILATLAALAQPLVTGYVIDAVTNGQPIWGLVALLVLLFVVGAGLSGVQGYVLGKSGEGIVFGLRRSLVGHLLRLPVGAHDRLRIGDLLSRVGNDTTLLRTALTESVTSLLGGILTFVGAVAFMFYIATLLFVVALSCVLVAAVAVLSISSRIRTASEEAQRNVGRLGAALERALGAIRTVKVSGAEGREEENISSEARAAYEAGVRIAWLEAIAYPSSIVALQASLVLVLALGTARLASGALSLGDLATFLLLLFYLIGPLLTVVTSYTNLQEGLAAVTRIKEVFDSPTEPSRISTPWEGDSKSLRAGTGSVVRFENVTFGYDPERPILRNVSFEVQPLTRTALVGPSGAGKSTVFSLLERFYGVDSGTVFFDGADVNTLPLAVLRGNIGYVEQDAPVMAGTILSNLLYAQPNATEVELEEILKLTNLKTLVGRLPEGLDTEVGDSGVMLSGGERQRVAIARTLLTRPRLLLLDEVTSQLDTRNELALREAVERISTHCTVMVIAHRLSTVVGADRIIVLNEGKVNNVGTHEELVSSDPLYRELAKNQLIGI